MQSGKGHIVRMPAQGEEILEPPEVPMEIPPPLPEALPESENFSYTKTVFLQRLFLQIVLMALLALLVSPIFLGADLPWVATILGLYGFYFLLSAISPLLTSHTLSWDNLVLRQGWYFHATIPIREIDSVEEVEEYAKVGIKFALTGGKLYVTASRYGLVQIQLKEPRRFPFALGKRADRIIIDVERRSKFVDMANDYILRHKIFIPASPDQWF